MHTSTTIPAAARIDRAVAVNLCNATLCALTLAMIAANRI